MKQENTQEGRELRNKVEKDIIATWSLTSMGGGGQ